MNFKEEIEKRGLKLIWVAQQIECNYSSLKVYMNNKALMPTWVCDELTKMFTK